MVGRPNAVTFTEALACHSSLGLATTTAFKNTWLSVGILLQGGNCQGGYHAVV